MTPDVETLLTYALAAFFAYGICFMFWGVTKNSIEDFVREDAPISTQLFRVGQCLALAVVVSFVAGEVAPKGFLVSLLIFTGVVLHGFFYGRRSGAKKKKEEQSQKRLKYVWMERMQRAANEKGGRLADEELVNTVHSIDRAVRKKEIFGFNLLTGEYEPDKEPTSEADLLQRIGNLPTEEQQDILRDWEQGKEEVERWRAVGKRALFHVRHSEVKKKEDEPFQKRLHFVWMERMLGLIDAELANAIHSIDRAVRKKEIFGFNLLTGEYEPDKEPTSEADLLQRISSLPPEEQEDVLRDWEHGKKEIARLQAEMHTQGN